MVGVLFRQPAVTRLAVDPRCAEPARWPTAGVMSVWQVPDVSFSAAVISFVVDPHFVEFLAGWLLPLPLLQKLP